eukprot:SAG22_NODE_2587_length_2410_cov_4.925573_4_plen_203_part_00
MPPAAARRPDPHEAAAEGEAAPEAPDEPSPPATERPPPDPVAQPVAQALLAVRLADAGAHAFAPDNADDITAQSALVVFVRADCPLCEKIRESWSAWIEKLPISTTFWTANTTVFPELSHRFGIKMYPGIVIFHRKRMHTYHTVRFHASALLRGDLPQFGFHPLAVFDTSPAAVASFAAGRRTRCPPSSSEILSTRCCRTVR